MEPPHHYPYRPSIFSLLPADPAGYAKVVKNVPALEAPFTNQHVLVPSGEDAKRPDAWEWFQNILGAERENTGWDSVPSRGWPLLGIQHRRLDQVRGHGCHLHR